MKFCLLVTVVLDIFIKEKNNTLSLPWISPLSFFYAKGVYSVLGQSKRRGTLLTIFRPPRIFQLAPPHLLYFTQISNPSPSPPAP